MPRTKSPSDPDYYPYENNTAKHLKQALNTIQQYEDINLTLLHQQLGLAIGFKSGATIERWSLEGYVAPKVHQAYRLGVEIVRRKGGDDAWLRKFLRLAGCKDVEAFYRAQQAQPMPDEQPSIVQPSNQQPTDEFPPVDFATVTDASFMHDREQLVDWLPERWIASRPHRMPDVSQIELQVELVSPSTAPHSFSSKELVRLFRHHHRLLILGDQGSGKTTLLIDLADELKRLFQTDAHQPLPLLLNLGAWSAKYASLNEWLVAELRHNFAIPSEKASAWLAHHSFVLLLDGLDEVQSQDRLACVDAINQVLNNEQVAVVVCCRSHAYKNLKRHLSLPSTVTILPLTAQQTETFLISAGEGTLAIRNLFAEHPEIQPHYTTLFQLNIMVATYHDKFATDLERIASSDQLHAHQVPAYIEHQLGNIDGKEQRADPQAQQWLAWLAWQMLAHSTLPFMIERLQPTWLEGAREWLHYRLLTAMIGAVVFTVVAGLVYGFVAALVVIALGGSLFFVRSNFELTVIKPVERLRWSRTSAKVGMFGGFVFAMFVGLSGALGFWLLFGLIGGQRLGYFAEWLVRARDERRPTNNLELLFGFLAGVLTTAIGSSSAPLSLWGGVQHLLIAGSVISLSGSWWQWRLQSFDWQRFISALIAGLLGGLLVWQSYVLVSQMHDLWIPGISAGLVHGVFAVLGNDWLGSLVGATLSGLAVAPIGGWVSGWIYSQELDLKNNPNHGIIQSCKNAFGIGIITAGLAAIEFEMIRWVASGMMGGGAAAVVFGGMAALTFGGFAALLHYGLRFILYWHGHLPWNYVGFLDKAADRLLLRKVGSGYLFFHRLIQEHFAVMTRLK